jgi:hypothetical protein
MLVISIALEQRDQVVSASYILLITLVAQQCAFHGFFTTLACGQCGYARNTKYQIPKISNMKYEDLHTYAGTPVVSPLLGERFELFLRYQAEVTVPSFKRGGGARDAP